MLIIGTGAVASFLGPRMRAAGESLQVYGSPGARLRAAAEWADPFLGVQSDATQLAQHECWLVVCKAWQNPEKLRLLATAPPAQRILVLQNGLEPEQGWEDLCSGTVERGLSTYGVRSVGPGKCVGGQSGEISLVKGSMFAAQLRAAGLKVRIEPSLERAVWTKLIVNASLNVVATLWNCLNGEVLEQPSARNLACRAAAEVACLAEVLGHDLGPQDPVFEMERVALATRDNVCSTLADIRSRRPTEYSHVNGALLKLARAADLHLPTLEELDQRFALVESTSAITHVIRRVAS